MYFLFTVRWVVYLAAVFFDVTQRSPKRTLGGALCDIQKTAAEGD